MQSRVFISILLLLSAFFCSGIKADNVNYADLADSLRLKIRLTSYVLVPVEKIDEKLPLIYPDVPFAFDAREISNLGLQKFWNKAKEQNFSGLVLVDKDAVVDTTNLSEIIFIHSDDFDAFNISEFDSVAEFPVFSVRELLLVKLQEGLLFDNLFNLWRFRGKLPNFLSSEDINLEESIQFVRKLNSYKKIFGVVVSDDDKLVRNILLKDCPSVQLSGNFCFPILTSSSLKPYKAGYQFSPDVINDAPNNEQNMKVFRAIRLERDYELGNHFYFKNGVKNLCRSDNQEMIVQNVLFTNDEQRGNVAFFKNSYIDAGIESKTILSSSFTISVWVKPTELTDNNSILGKGSNFVLKIHGGKLTFTMAGIKDYISNSSPIEVGKWTHVVVVFSAIENKLKFFLNGEMTEQIELIADYKGSDHSLLIGSNLWEEFFIGYMGDVKIWERELNEQEILEDYLDISIKKGVNKELIVIAGLFVIGLFLFIFLRNNKKKRLPVILSENREETKLFVFKETDFKKEIQCFGGLRILCDDEGNDISRKLSPKLKQLFVLILLHSSFGKKGVSSKRMTDLLWPGMNASNAKNTRGTSIQNLRQILSVCEGLTVAFHDKMWLIEVTPDIYCDYFEVEKLLLYIERNIDSGIITKDVESLVSILSKGKFLPAIDPSWMDTFREQISSRIIEVCLRLLARNKEIGDLLSLELAGIVSLHDELNETALQVKVRILTAQGKHSLATLAYKSYVKLYSELYNSIYPVDFLDLLNDQ